MNKFSCSFIFAILALYLNSCTLDEAVCEKDGHLYGDICEPESVEHCGSHDKNCYNFPGIKDAMCVYRRCIATRCQTGYHIDNTKTTADLTETSDTSDIVCIQDNESTCGPGQINCTETVTGWKTGICSEGVCKPTACQPNYHISSNQTSCEPDDAEHCGSPIDNCLLRPGWQSADCEDGKCKLIQCTSGYQPSEDNDTCTTISCGTGFHLTKDQSKCEQDDVNHCGSYNNDCTVRAGWVDGNCSNGQCDVTRCDTMYYISKDNTNTVCLPNTNDNCGGPGIKCPDYTNCDKGSCSSSTCSAGYSLCEGIGCVDFSSTSTCGGCEPCSIAHAMSVQCNYKNNPICNQNDTCCTPLLCETGYHVEGNKCVEDTIDACGQAKAKCTSSSPNTSPTCVEGKCSFECKSGYGDCNNNPSDGCEVKFDDYGLTDCNTCSNEYTACGNHIISNSISVPLCLKQGNYYSNHHGNSKSQQNCAENYYSWHKDYNYNGYAQNNCSNTSGSKYINYEYKNNDSSLVYMHTDHYQQTHNYKQVDVTWVPHFYEWTSEHCALACNSNTNISSNNNGRHTDNSGNTIEAWSHICQPKQTCHQYDAFKVDREYNNWNHFYFDYGCSD